ncbi:MAG: hypothetical protein FJ104_00180, partial [Deltaproteobacteria bacterium]|nr:hypothetical protein [Deltaproteobacteria bacterium]
MISRPAFRISQAIAITLAASAALQVLGALSLVLRPAASRDVVHLGLVEAFTFVLGVLALLAIEGRDEPLAASLGLRRAAAGHVALGVAMGPLLHLPAATTEAMVARFLPTPDENVAARIALLTGDGPLRVALIAAVVAVVGPLV